MRSVQEEITSISKGYKESVREEQNNYILRMN